MSVLKEGILHRTVQQKQPTRKYRQHDWHTQKQNERRRDTTTKKGKPYIHQHHRAGRHYRIVVVVMQGGRVSPCSHDRTVRLEPCTVVVADVPEERLGFGLVVAATHVRHQHLVRIHGSWCARERDEASVRWSQQMVSIKGTRK